MKLRTLAAGFPAIALVTLIGGSGSARADEDVAPPPESCPPGTVPQAESCPPGSVPQEQPAPPPQQTKRKRLFAPHQMALSVGGGFAAFAQGRVKDTSSLLGSWDVGFLIGARSPIAFEASYLGTAGTADDVQDAAPLTTTQVTGNVRLQLPWVVQPFINAGVGWIHLHRGSNVVDSPTAATNFDNDNNGVVVPVGGGLSVYPLRHGQIEARADYRFVTSAKDFTNTTQRPDMWTAQLRAGYAF